jgi:hypothetical protein
MSGPAVQVPALECTDIVLRALRASSWVDNLHEAFLLRAGERDTGISVSYNCSPDVCRNTLQKSYGVVSLHVGKVRTLGLDVVPDELSHANITGLPSKEDNPAEAEHVANLLAKQARFVDKGLKKRTEDAPQAPPSPAS